MRDKPAVESHRQISLVGNDPVVGISQVANGSTRCVSRATDALQRTGASRAATQCRRGCFEVRTQRKSSRHKANPALRRIGDAVTVVILPARQVTDDRRGSEVVSEYCRDRIAVDPLDIDITEAIVVASIDTGNELEIPQRNSILREVTVVLVNIGKRQTSRSVQSERK